MSNSQMAQPDPSFVGMPRSRLGWWSIGLASYFSLFVAWPLYVQATPNARRRSFPIRCMRACSRRGGGLHHRDYRRCAGPRDKARAVRSDPVSVLLGALCFSGRSARLAGLNQ